jgi:hypothetical protein
VCLAGLRVLGPIAWWAAGLAETDDEAAAPAERFEHLLGYLSGNP